MLSTLITDPEQVSREWLQAVLRANGYLPDGQITSFAKTGSKPFGAATHDNDSLLQRGVTGYSFEACWDRLSPVRLAQHAGSPVGAQFGSLGLASLDADGKIMVCF